MKRFLNNKDKKLYYSDLGKGTVIVLLHGYLESLEIWEEFALKLSKSYRVISFDIPGHGKSETFAEVHTIEFLTATIYNLLKELNIEKCFMIGHSMGGYITLMFNKIFPEILSGFSLFHSHPFADTEETKKKRLREIEFVKAGKKDLIATFNIPNAFATDNLSRFQNEIEKAKNIALQTSEKGIIANLFAMMNRSDLSESLSKTKIPFLFIVGKKDNYIDYNSVLPKIKLPKNSELKVLENSGHMGFIEEMEVSLRMIEEFVKNTEKYF